jgi:hypothetical protein
MARLPMPPELRMRIGIYHEEITEFRQAGKAANDAADRVAERASAHFSKHVAQAKLPEGSTVDLDSMEIVTPDEEDKKEPPEAGAPEVNDIGGVVQTTEEREDSDEV